jgi:predicted transcriptional regulator
MARKSLDALGELQKAVMELIWEQGEATVGKVRECLKRDPEPAYTTILSVMQKLEKSGWLKHRAEGRGYVYFPTRSRDEAGTSTLRTFIDRVFGGDRLLLFQHLLEDEDLSAQELSALRSMIDRKRKGEGTRP